MMHRIYVYGTLRPGAVAKTIKGNGTMLNLGGFPGILLDENGPEFTCEPVDVDDETLADLDRYEGYREGDAHSLYVRVPFKDGMIYEFNRSGADVETIPSGDWLIHTGSEKGWAAGKLGADEQEAM